MRSEKEYERMPVHAQTQARLSDRIADLEADRNAIVSAIFEAVPLDHARDPVFPMVNINNVVSEIKELRAERNRLREIAMRYAYRLRDDGEPAEAASIIRMIEAAKEATQ